MIPGERAAFMNQREAGSCNVRSVFFFMFRTRGWNCTQCGVVRFTVACHLLGGVPRRAGRDATAAAAEVSRLLVPVLSPYSSGRPC